jgi:hypothetical protein
MGSCDPEYSQDSYCYDTIETWLWRMYAQFRCSPFGASFIIGEVSKLTKIDHNGDNVFQDFSTQHCYSMLKNIFFCCFIICRNYLLYDAENICVVKGS